MPIETKYKYISRMPQSDQPPPRIDSARMRGIDDASRFNHYKIELVAKAVGLAQL